MPYYLNVYTKESQWDLPVEPGPEYIDTPNPEQVQAIHILVKHKDSRRPSSWREENITRTKEEARKLVTGYLDEVSGFCDGAFSFCGIWMGVLPLTFSNIFIGCVPGNLKICIFLLVS